MSLGEGVFAPSSLSPAITLECALGQTVRIRLALGTKATLDEARHVGSDIDS